jgi:hypothetical protein
VPLTEEQKKQKLEELRIKLAEKRAKQAELSVEENKANEVGIENMLALLFGKAIAEAYVSSSRSCDGVQGRTLPRYDNN